MRVRYRTLLLLLLACCIGIVLWWVSIDPLAGIQVTEASYGMNCGGKPGNITSGIGKICNGRQNCTFPVDVRVAGIDPAGGCDKDFALAYVCIPSSTVRYLSAPPGRGSRQVFHITCGER